MKTILRILVILLVGVLVSSALYLAIDNTSLLSDTNGFPDGTTELGVQPEMPTSDASELSVRPEGGGDHHAASLSRGLSSIGIALVKISGITLIVVLVQKAHDVLKKQRHLIPSLGR